MVTEQGICIEVFGVRRDIGFYGLQLLEGIYACLGLIQAHCRIKQRGQACFLHFLIVRVCGQ